MVKVTKSKPQGRPTVTLKDAGKGLYVMISPAGKRLTDPKPITYYKHKVSAAKTVADLNRRLGDKNDPRIDVFLSLEDSELLKRAT
ncbi:hypothetical protein OK351_13615 [Glutamicibacter sp. MNS18]|uniref:hypothetical protein n=1 Tax=Glutamicibacter sp. MNS18 TaxID=2989817 RepID=UPI0022360B9E|nr:hypothetical protein [Glutamicibacter sp. MNS18]MCW4466531.1 hypothetical protein [Glutamicibacter sp. MNS18]